MKKIVALLITVATFTTSFAQSSRRIEETRDIINGGPYSGNNGKVYGDEGSRYPSSTNSEDAIYRDYDRKIQAVRNNPFLSSAEKERRIRDLQYERDQRIREMNGYSRNSKDYGSYGNKNNRRYNNDDDCNNGNGKGYKQNNGKHKGWTKGKGNIQKNRTWKD